MQVKLCKAQNDSAESGRNGTHILMRLFLFFREVVAILVQTFPLSFFIVARTMTNHIQICCQSSSIFYRMRFLFAFTLFCLLLFGGAVESLAESPREYERAKDELAALQKDTRRSKWREPWEDLAERFMRVYEKQTQWRNRPAALYRSALALDELARRSGRGSDCTKAEARYRILWEKHAASVLADDALYRAARLRAEKRRDQAGALKLLEKLCAEYPKGDMADEAAAYIRKLDPERKISRPSPEKKAVKAKGRASAQKGAFQFHVRRVLLDAGHGGKDPGTQHNGILERTVTLDLAKRVGSILAAHGMDVKYTRFSNRWVSLDERADKVRTTRADLFISIHVNANPSPQVQGFETYYLDFARTSAASRLAAVENALKGRSAASREKLPASKLFQVQQQESARLARNIQSTTLGVLRKKKYATVDGGIKTAPFHVLRKSGVPGVLIEVGYCTNKREAAWLAQSAYRAQLARGIAYGILAYANRK